MKVLLLYYTGTHNTAYVTNILRNKFINENVDIDTIEVNIDTLPVDLAKYDLVGIGYPIYAFNCSSFFIKYLKKLNFTNTTKYFIYKNSGESLGLNNASSRKIKHMLRKNKCELLCEYHFLMPYNIIFKFSDNCVKEMLHYVDYLADILIYDLKNKIGHKIKNNPFYEAVSLAFTLQTFGAWFNSFFYRVDKDKCINCNKCIVSCPTHNISKVNDEFKFDHRCLMCMRCSFSCPTNAIRIGILNNWKVNGDYHFNKLLKDESIKGDFMNHKQKRFYNCYKKSYEYINRKHKDYFGF